MSEENETLGGTQSPDDQTDIQQEIANLPPEELRYLQLVATLQRVVTDVQGWLAKAEQALHNHNLRMNVLETFLVHPEFADLRAKFAEGKLELADLQRIATEYIQPQLQARAAEMNAAREAAIKKAQEEQAPSAIINPNTGRPASEAGTILTPDGRQVVIRED